MAPFREQSSHSFTDSLIVVRIPKSVVSRPVPEYNVEGYPIIHVNKHESSLLGKSDDDDYLALLFPSTLSGTNSSWFIGLPGGLIGSWVDLKTKILQRYMGNSQLLRVWSPWMRTSSSRGKHRPISMGVIIKTSRRSIVQSLMEKSFRLITEDWTL